MSEKPSPFPITRVIDNLAGQDGMTHSDVERVLWEIDKPFKKITLHDVSEKWKEMRQQLAD